nr:MAG TPA: hypothetical protein [Caudoviricetes sp.]
MFFLSGYISSCSIICFIQIFHTAISFFNSYRTVVWLFIVPSTNLKFNISQLFYIVCINIIGIYSITIINLTKCRVANNSLKLKIL